jgi:hypothetical protein
MGDDMKLLIFLGWGFFAIIWLLLMVRPFAGGALSEMEVFHLHFNLATAVLMIVGGTIAERMKGK